MLPDVETDDWRVPMHEGGILVWQAVQMQFAVLIRRQPRPAAAEKLRGRIGELFLEIFHGAESGLNVRYQFLIYFFLRSHDLPEKGVVRMPAAVIADGGAVRLLDFELIEIF